MLVACANLAFSRDRNQKTQLEVHHLKNRARLFHESYDSWINTCKASSRIVLRLVSLSIKTVVLDRTRC